MPLRTTFTLALPLERTSRLRRRLLKEHLLAHPLELLLGNLGDRTPVRLCLRAVFLVEAVTALVQGVDVGLALVLVQRLGHAGLEGASVVC